MSTKHHTVPKYIGGGAPLNITTTDDGCVVVAGEIDRETGERLRVALASAPLIDDAVHIDMSGVAFMDSQGLRILLEAGIMRGDVRGIVIDHASAQVQRLLEMTGLAETFGLDG